MSKSSNFCADCLTGDIFFIVLCLSTIDDNCVGTIFFAKLDTAAWIFQALSSTTTRVNLSGTP